MENDEDVRKVDTSVPPQRCSMALGTLRFALRVRGAEEPPIIGTNTGISTRTVARTIVLLGAILIANFSNCADEPGSAYGITRWMYKYHEPYKGVWQLRNRNWETIAEEYNCYYLVVGMSVEYIDRITGYGPTSTSSIEDRFEGSAECSHRKKVHCWGPFEFEFTPDNSKVARFRIGYLTRSGLQKYTKWEDRNLQIGESDPSRYTGRRRLSRYRNLFTSLGAPFSKAEWSSHKNPWDSHGRLLDDFVRSYPIIGMTRNEIEGLLGKSSTYWSREYCKRDGRSYSSPYTMEEQVLDPLCANSEEYCLSGPRCGQAPTALFELSYLGDRVISYRRSTRLGGWHRRRTLYEFIVLDGLE